jgi:putative transposase
LSTKAQPYFTTANTQPAFELRFHFGWPTRRRQATFEDAAIRDALTESFQEVTTRYGYHGLETAVEPAAVRSLVSLRPDQTPSAVTRVVRGNLATSLRRQLGVRELWSRGWFCRSVGHCTNETVQAYVAQQYEHHQAAPSVLPAAAAKARYRGEGDPAELRKSAHAVFECNLHVVLVTRRRLEFLDLDVAESLVGYWRRVCEKKEWVPWEINVVWNHAHLFLGVQPRDQPGEVALSLMNNAAWFLEQRHGRVLLAEKMLGIWRPSFYVGTVGSATSAQVASFLGQKEGLEG